MGTVLRMLNKRIVLPASVSNGASFSNAVGESALYKAAQRNLDVELARKSQFEARLNDAKTALNDYIAKYSIIRGDNGKIATYDELIRDDNFNDAIERIVFHEKYGRPDSPIWKDKAGDLRTSIPTAIVGYEWYGNGPGAIFENGVMGHNPWRQAQIDLVQHWAKNQYRPTVQILAAKVVDIQKKIESIDINILKYTKQRDAALIAEQKASEQRIKENMSDPAYVAAQAAAASKKAMSRNILILGGLGIVVIGAAIFLRRRS